MADGEGPVIPEYTGAPMSTNPPYPSPYSFYSSEAPWPPGYSQIDATSGSRFESYDANNALLTNNFVYTGWNNNPIQFHSSQDLQSYTPVPQAPFPVSTTISSSEPSPLGFHHPSPSLHQDSVLTPPMYPQYGHTPSQQTKAVPRKRRQSSQGQPPFESTKQSTVRSEKAGKKTRRKSKGGDDQSSTQPPEDNYIPFPDEEHHKRLQQRNRQAANRFRARKREDAAKLRVEEEESEVQNRQLCSSVKELTQEVYLLKMQLLQHSECDCVLIQDYIKTEAQRYIHGLGTCDRRPSMAGSEWGVMAPDESWHQRAGG